MKKLLKVILAGVAFVIVTQATKFGMREYRDYSDDANFRKNAIEAFEKLNNETPIILDKNTKITEIRAENDSVIYSVILDGIDYESIDVSQFGKIQLITNLFTVCQNEDTKYLIKNGFDIEYEYFTSSKLGLFSNRIAEKDCQPFFGKDNSALADHYIELQLELVPMKLDSETNWINIKRSNNSIELVYEFVNYKKEELDLDAVRKFVEENSPLKNCAGPDTKVFLEGGITIIDTYVDKNGSMVYSFETDFSAC